MCLEKLLKPDKIVIIGASEKEGFGGDTCRNTMQLMAADRYFFVNPKRDTVFGKKCYKSVLDLPESVDVAVICTPLQTVETILKDCHKMGVRGAVVYASGYSEVRSKEGIQAELDLQKLCNELGISLMGPNCAGFINYVDMVSSFAFISNDRDRRGSVGFISQSGQLVLTMMDRPGTAFSYVISSGNSKLISVEEYLHFLVEDENTKVISIYLEGTKDAASLAAALHAAAKKKKPVVVLKTGKSEKAQEIAASHTGSLSGNDKIYNALFEKYGVIRVDDLEELISTAQALAVLKELPKGKKLGAISLSGGETGITADLGELMNIEFGKLSEETLERFREILPSYADPNNPLDLTATLSYDIDKFSNALEILMKDHNVDMVAIGYTLLDEIADNAIYYMSQAMKKVSAESWAKPMVIVPFAEVSRNVDYVNDLKKIGIPVLPTSQYAYKIIRNIVRFSTYNMAEYQMVSCDEPTSGKCAAKGRVALSEYESKNYLKEKGLHLDSYHLVTSPDEAAEAFLAINEEQKSGDGIKVVAKIDSRDILHKSDMGGVILNIGSEQDVRAAYDQLMKRASENCPDARINGVQIAVMSDPGVEIIIGVKNDPQFGPSILCGLGGVFVEVFKDVSLALAPISRTEAVKMITSLKSYTLLRGYRGMKPCNIDMLADMLVHISNIAYAEKDSLVELDINPAFVNEKGVSVADALVILKQ